MGKQMLEESRQENDNTKQHSSTICNQTDGFVYQRNLFIKFVYQIYQICLSKKYRLSTMSRHRQECRERGSIVRLSRVVVFPEHIQDNQGREKTLNF